MISNMQILNACIKIYMIYFNIIVIRYALQV